MGQLHVKKRRTVYKVCNTLMLSIFGAVMLLPFLWMLSASFKIESEIFQFPIQWIPSQPTLKNYQKVWFGKNPFFRFYFNSIKVSFLSVSGTVAVSALAAYAFAKIPFRGRNAIFLLYLSTMMIPPQVTLIPRFLMMNTVGLMDTHASIIIQHIFSVIGVFLLRQFFVTIPNEINEAAKIDGAGELAIFLKLILPLSKAALSSLVILSFVWSWNEYLSPLIFLRSSKLYTIPVAIDYFMSEMGTEYGLVMAAAVSAIFPLILIYLFQQKNFIASIASSAVKG